MSDENIELPTYAETAELGEKGVRMVCSVVEDDFHWVFRPTTKTDIGVDGEIEFITETRK